MQGIELYTEVEKEVHKIFDAMQTLKDQYKITSLHLESCNGMEQFWYSQGKGAIELGERYDRYGNKRNEKFERRKR